MDANAVSVKANAGIIGVNAKTKTFCFRKVSVEIIDAKPKHLVSLKIDVGHFGAKRSGCYPKWHGTYHAHAKRFPRVCRLAGILNLGSEWPLSCRFRFARRERSQQRRRWAAADANQHWFKECMALANTAGETLGSQTTHLRIRAERRSEQLFVLCQ